uniref:Ion transport domain-containing protein n=1 Tax=Pygocentrus nattereri TaxID=42514 RepID=A0A3B4C8Y7_PYGNA
MDTRAFQSAPYYQQERAKTFFRRVEMIRAKLVKEVDYQLEQRHKRSDEVVINVEEDEGSETSQESTTVAVYVSRWERLKRRVLNFPPMSVYAGRILENQHFNRLIICFIMLNTVLLGVQAEISDKPDMSLANEVLNGINWVVVAVFYLEIALKWMVGFWQFWKNAWNIFDFIFTLLSVLPEIIMSFSTDNAHATGAVKVIRTFRVLRALKITAKFTQVRLTLLAITKSVMDLVPVFLLLFMLMYVYAVTGMTLFKEQTQYDAENLTYGKSFDGISNSFSTIFILLTIDHWYSLLEEGWKVPGLNKVACGAFVISWIILGAFIFRNLFVGFMVSNFKTIRSDFAKEVQSIEKRQKVDLFKAEVINRTMSQTSVQVETSASSSLCSPDETYEDWESKVLQYLDAIKEQEEDEQEVVWPRDTLFRYYELMEALQRNLEEKKRLHHLKGKSCVNCGNCSAVVVSSVDV